MDPDPVDQQAFDAANSAYYEAVDWALDISEVEANELDIRGVPARLIRRDPETQVVVSREAALAGEWRQLDKLMACGELRVGLELMLKNGDSDVVLMAPKRARHFRDLLAGIEQLRAAGIAEPD